MKVGDQVYFQFRLGEIEKVEDNKIKSVSSNGFLHSGFDLSGYCFPATKDIADVSEIFRNTYQRVRESANPLSLNYPDIFEHFTYLWKIECLSVMDGKSPSMKEVSEFASELLDEIYEAKHKMVGGKRLFRY